MLCATNCPESKLIRSVILAAEHRQSTHHQQLLKYGEVVMGRSRLCGIVLIVDIYDEFSFGEKSPQAVKDFLSYASSNWKRKTRYALLVGDASYDPKNYLGFGDWDLVPTKLIDTGYMEASSDDWNNNTGRTSASTARSTQSRPRAPQARPVIPMTMARSTKSRPAL